MKLLLFHQIHFFHILITPIALKLKAIMLTILMVTVLENNIKLYFKFIDN